jgi:hypothetical protein
MLDALAVAEPSRSASIHTMTSTVRHGSDGLIVIVLATVTLHEADLLARARHGMGTSIAIALDTASWAHRPRTEETAGAWDLLRAAGWAVLPLARGESLAEVWRHLSFSGGFSGGTAASTARTSEVSA